MQWRHRIAVVLVTVVAGLQVSGTICAMVCDSTARTAARHHGSGPCEEPASPSSGPHISGLSEHDCSTHDDAIRQAATTAAERADMTAKSAPFMLSAGRIESGAIRDSQIFFEYRSPPGTAPPPTTPLVLRV